MDTTVQINTLWLLVCTALVFLMQAGFGCLESGLSRSKNNINVAIKNVVDVCITAAVFWLFGYGLMFGESVGGLFGGTSFLFHDPSDSRSLTAFFLFQLAFCGTAITIASGVVAERMRIQAYFMLAIILSGLIYPVFGHWVWGGVFAGGSTGWLADLGFIDFAGSTVVHSTGAWAAFAAAILIGPRLGRFHPGQPPRKFQGSNLPLAALGVFILWFGWFGFNGGSTLAFDAQVPDILLNTILAAAFGGLGVLATQCVLHRHLSLENIINGILAGLVAVTASCNIISASTAMIIGVAAALIMQLSAYLLERILQVDDVVGGIPVHGFAGAWGTIAVALFGDQAAFLPGVGRLQQLAVQLLGIVICFAWSFGVTFVLLSVAHRRKHLRVTAAEERLGLNIVEHGSTSELQDLLSIMDAHVTGVSSVRAEVDEFTDTGLIATHFNRVLDAKDDAIRQRQQREHELEAAWQRTEHVLWCVPTILIGIDLEDRVTQWNREAANALDVFPEEVRGQRLQHIAIDWDVEHILDRIDYCRSQQAPSTIQELGYRRADGCDRILQVLLCPMPRHVDAVDDLLLMASDITEFKQIEEELRDKEMRTRAILDNAAEGIVTISDKGIVESFNAAAASMFGYLANDIVGKNISMLIPPQHHGHDAPYDAQYQPQLEGVYGELEGRRKDGSAFPIHVAVSDTLTSGRRLFTAIVRDLTELKTLQSELSQAQKLESIGQLAAGIAHEINTPTQFVGDNVRFLQDSFHDLNGLLVRCERLIKDSDSDSSVGILKELTEAAREADLEFLIEELPQSIAQTLDGVTRIATIVKAMKEFSHPGGPEKSAIDLNKGIESTITVSRNEWKYVADVTTEFATDLPLVPCHGSELNQAILNIIVNGAHAIADSRRSDTDPKGNIDITTRYLGEWVEIRISDTGGGIPDEIRTRIFDPFFTTKEVGKGTGQGLAIAHNVIVKQHGGAIDVETEIGVGTTFIIRLPCSLDPAEERFHDEEASLVCR